MNLENISFVVLVLLSCFYSMLYILHNLYYKTNNFKIKKCVNKILPFFTKYHRISIIYIFIFLLVFVILNFKDSYLFGFTLFVISFINLIFTYNQIKRFVSNICLQLTSYTLLLYIVLIPILD